MTASRSRRRSAAYAALALALCGSLALTGCNSKSKKSKKTSSSSSASKSKKHKIISGGGSAAASRSVRNCHPLPYQFRLTQTSNPDGHVVVKYINTTSRTCRLHNAPLLRFDNAAKPLGLLSGEPGLLGHNKIDIPAKGTAYAVIPTSTAATKGTDKKSVTISFMGISGDSPTIGGATVKFGKGQPRNPWPLSVGNTKVTNWVPSLKGALVAADLHS